MNKKKENLFPDILRKTGSNEDREHESNTSNPLNHTVKEERRLDSTHYGPKYRGHESNTSNHTVNEERRLDSSHCRPKVTPRPLPRRPPHLAENKMQAVHGDAIHAKIRSPHTLDEDTATKVNFLQKQQRSSQRRAMQTGRQIDEIIIQNRRNEETINDLKAKVTNLKSELDRIKAEKNKLQHQHNEEKKDNIQRNKNISEQLTNNEQKFEKISQHVTNSEQQFEKISQQLTTSEQQFKMISEKSTNSEQQFENMSKQLTQLDKKSNEIEALHSTVDSVKQAQAVLDTSLKQTKDLVDTVQYELKSELKETTSKVMEGQASFAKDMQNMFDKQQTLIQEIISKMNVENPKGNSAQRPHWRPP